MTNALFELISPCPRWTVLTGAGLSTGSGIPDYRDAQGAWKRPPPVTFGDFMSSAAVRQRYWARSLIGWPVFSQALPNPAHKALAQLESMGRIGQLITQNVDGLHQRAGSHRVVDLHGRLDTVRCMQCTLCTPRLHWQNVLLQANPQWQTGSANAAPDGDADLEGVDFAMFEVPPCSHCGGIVKPDVVFYGENVPQARVRSAMEALERSDALLIVGSSLMVYSGLRFVHAAKARNIPIAAINLGVTRADAQLDVKLSAPCDDALIQLINQLQRQENGAAREVI